MRNQKLEALRLITQFGCENYDSGGCWDDPRRDPYSKFGHDDWCPSCIAQAALEDRLPLPITCIELKAFSD
jgi:hypothetical protein